MIRFDDVYRNRRVLVTGHTGFKGSWLSLWLSELGAHVHGYSLAPETTPNHFDLLKLHGHSCIADIRDLAKLKALFDKVQPEFVFHLAAQPLVRRSYREPLITWSTNVMGTANVLECCRSVSSLKSVLVVTTDKCYENLEQNIGYRETDRLGGYDPYSASKAATEILVASYRRSFFSTPNSPLIATARAGNVIGGGDWTEDRLIPDLIRAITLKQTLMIRSPNAVRPWQHVLESLHGYLLLGQRLFHGDTTAADAWNFGPAVEDNRNVASVLNELQKHWPQMSWQLTSDAQPHETQALYLDSSKAIKQLNWQPVWSLDQALQHVAQWYRAYLETGSVISRDQLLAFMKRAPCDFPLPSAP